MKHDELIAALKNSGATLVSVFEGLTHAQLRWKPSPDKWSLLEILCHVCDEERDDFRRRLALTLEDPEQDWPPIDPEGWVTQRNYNETDPTAMLALFRGERTASLDWLVGLDVEEWSVAHEHPLGPLAAGDLLSAWVAHDLLHTRQAAWTRLQWLREVAEPFTPRYAMP